MHARCKINGKSSVIFPVTNRVKQGCMLAPTLFSINFLWCYLMHLVARIMESTFNNALTVLSSTSKGFKQRPKWRLISSTSFCSSPTVHWMLLPKPTCKTVLISSQWPGTILAKLSAPKKGGVMHQPTPKKPYVESNITIKGQRPKVVEKFTYLGSTLSKSIVLDDKVNMTRKSECSF